jgi:Fe-S cluster assembly protein SufD
MTEQATQPQVRPAIDAPEAPARAEGPTSSGAATHVEDPAFPEAPAPPQTPARAQTPAPPGAATQGGARERERDRDLGAAAPYLADWEEFASQLPASEPAAIKALRRAAIERFGTLGFPTMRQEEWRFTNLAPLARATFRLPAAPGATGANGGKPRITPADLAPWTFAAAARLVFVDGRLSRELSAFDGPGRRTPALPQGVVVESLAAALERDPQLPYLGRHSSFQDQPFVALNTAFLCDGALVVVPRRAVVELPIHLLYLSTAGGGGRQGRPGSQDQGRGQGPHGSAQDQGRQGSQDAQGSQESQDSYGRRSSQPALAMVSYPRNLIVAEEGSQLTVVETYVGEGAYFSCGVTELFAGAGAVVDHYKVQRESRDAFHLATFQLYGDRASAVSSHSIALGGGLVRNDVNALLDGEGIDCILNGLYIADGRQLIDNHMRVEHAKPHCASHELYKGILDGKARSVFNGLIHVHKGAQKTDAKQSNRNLLLSADAIANSNPRLEIFADDVKCTHGSTVGQLDDDAIFYLRSRGIGADAARSLLTYAFASDILARIKVEPVRHDLEEYLFARLPQGEVVRQAV